jgi:hypothetical protein
VIRVFDFRCKFDHVTEHFVDSASIDETIKCECGEPAQRQIAAPRAQLEGFSGAFPGAADKWERNRESHMRKERRNLERNGTYK